MSFFLQLSFFQWLCWFSGVCDLFMMLAEPVPIEMAVDLINPDEYSRMRFGFVSTLFHSRKLLPGSNDPSNSGLIDRSWDITLTISSSLASSWYEKCMITCNLQLSKLTAHPRKGLSHQGVANWLVTLGLCYAHLTLSQFNTNFSFTLGTTSDVHLIAGTAFNQSHWRC